MSKIIALRNGKGTIPTIGLGTWTLHGDQGNSDEVERAALAAIDAGYRHIDCAWVYFTQDGVGRAIAAKIKEGVVTREELFITTKLWDTHHNPDLVMEELKDSLNDLQMTYVDLFLIHWPMCLQDQPVSKKSREAAVPLGPNGKGIVTNYPMEEVWKKMEECQKAGLTRNIGLSNFNSKQLDRILSSCTIKPSNMQVEISPYFNNSKLRDFCFEKGLTVTAYAPLGAPGRPWAQLEEPNIFEEPLVQEIAKAKGKTVAQVILRYHLQCGLVVIPKSITPSRIKENIQVYDFELSEDEMEQVASLDRNMRVYNESFGDNHPEYPFNELF